MSAEAQKALDIATSILQMGSWSSKESQPIQNEFDVIIIGGGTAGCLLANRLSANGKWNVLLVEAGKSSSKVLLANLPAGYVQMWHDERFDYNYFSVPQPNCNGRKMYQPRGKMLGGCSSINAQMYHRGPASDYDRWATLTNDPSWSYEAMLPFFKKAEGFEETTRTSDYVTKVSDKYHGRDGEWKVSYHSAFLKVSSVFVKAAEALGIPFNPDFNAESTLGVGRIQTFIDAKDCARSNTEKAFLSASVLARPNLTVLTDAKCLKLIIEHGECKGAIVLHKGQEKTFRARKEVIVSCGAFDSPRILAASGLTHPGIGKNLQDHLGISISFKIPESADPSLQTLDQWNGVIYQYLALFQYLYYRTGPAATNVGEAVAFYRTKLQPVLDDDPSSGPAAPHVELIAAPVLAHHHEGQRTLTKFRTRPEFDWKQFEWRGRYITLIALLLNPYSRGDITFKEGQMDINPNYLSDQRDLDVLIEAAKFIRRLASEGYPKAGLEGLEQVTLGKEVISDESLAVCIRDQSETYYHPVGTCKMGVESDPMAVVSPQLKVYGTKNLRVVDASIMPVIVAAHTCAPTVAIAEKAAEMVLRDLES